MKALSVLINIVFLIFALNIQTACADEHPEKELSAVNLITNAEEILDNFNKEIHRISTGWTTRIQPYAEKLFLSLALLSLLWTLIEMALKRAEIGEIFSELSKFIIVTGLFWYLLIHGPSLALSITDSFMKIAEIGISPRQVTTTDSMPTRVFDKGIDISTFIFSMGGNLATIKEPVKSTLIGLALVIASIYIIVIHTYIAFKIFILYLKIYAQCYAGCFFLGFGGGKWFRETSINYYRSIISSAAQFFAVLFIACLIINMGSITHLTDSLFYSTKNMHLVSTFLTLVLMSFVPSLGLFLMASLPGAIAGLFSSNYMSSNQSASQAIMSAARGTAKATAMTVAGATVVGGVSARAANFASSAVGQLMGHKAAISDAKSASGSSRQATSPLAGTQANPQAMLDKATQLFNGGNCSKRNETAARSIASNLENDRNVPQSVADNARKLRKKIDSQMPINDAVRTANNQGNDDMSAQEQRDLNNTYREAAQSWQRESTDPSEMLNSATRAFNNGDCDKSTEQASLQMADAIANSRYVPQEVAEQAAQLAGDIRGNMENNDKRRQTENRDMTPLSKSDREGIANHLASARNDWSGQSNTPSGMLNRAMNMYQNGNCTKAQEQEAIMLADSVADNPDVPSHIAQQAKQFRNEMRSNSEDNDTNRQINNVSMDSLTDDQKKQVQQTINSAAQGWKEQNSGGEVIQPEIEETAKNNASYFGSMLKMGMQSSANFINNHQPLHMIDSYQAGHEKQRERTENYINEHQE